MGFAKETGYTPITIEEIMNQIMLNINIQFSTTYTYETFVGTNFYKYFYALAQELQKSEVKTSEIFLKLQQYIEIMNEKISRPVNTNPGLIDKLAAEGYLASIKPPNNTDRGKVFVCVDVDNTDPDYADTKLDICTILSQSVALGTPTQGDQSENIVLTNGQSFAFKYALPDRKEVALKLTLTLSENNQVAIDSPDDVKNRLMANIAARYKLGKNFEPQRYFTTADAPWTSQVLLEWTTDVTAGVINVTPTWHDEVYDAEFDDLFMLNLALVQIVEV